MSFFFSTFYLSYFPSVDYVGFSDASRASIQMTHSAFGPTVSLEEAQRIERETAEHLLKSRKLSLIVDLDQTIVHATVDPTVGEWIAEGEAWEKGHAEKLAKAVSSTPRPSNKTDNDLLTDDECNPNWEALKDVKRFRLGPESFGPPSMRGAQRKGKHKLVENEGCMYYVKPRLVNSPVCVFLVAYTFTDLVGKSFFVRQPPSMKCMFIQWELVPTRKKCVLQLIRMEAFSEDVY